MQTDFRHNNSLDDFSRRVSKKLQKHTQPVDSDVWNAIESELSSGKTRIVPFWWAVAAVAAIFAGVFFFSRPYLSSISEKTSEMAQNTKVSTEISEKVVDEPKPQSETQYPISSTNKLIAVYQAKQTVENKTSETDEIPVHEIAEDLKEEKRENTDNQPKEKIKTEINKTNTENDEKTANNQSETKKRPQLIARLGASAIQGDLLSGGGSNGDMMNSDKNFPGFESNVNNGSYNQLSPSDYSEIYHLPPVSVSVLLELPINKKWSVESGLTYTYLVSKFSKKNDIEYLGRLYQHYLGIPMNLKMNLLQGDLWRVYALGGGTIEKGITSLYKQEIRYANGTVLHFDKRADIDGVQLSAHLATGFDYRINPNIRIFGEPYLIYYFDNNQPMSSRTENPLTLGINAGVRIQFK